MTKQLELKIYGLVQGVFYRHYTQQKARQLNLAGFVRNASDGTVEITAIGKEQNLQKLLDWCYSGPPTAKVKKIDHRFADQVEQFNGFIIQ